MICNLGKRIKLDYNLAMISPKKEVAVVKLNEKLVTWGDSVYSCESLQYFTDSNIIFEQIEDTKYYNKLIAERIWEC